MVARTGQREGSDESGGVDGPTKEVSTEDGDDNQQDDDRDDDSGSMVTESEDGRSERPMDDKVDNESDGRDYGEREVDPDSQSSSALAVYLTMDA